MKKIYSVLLSVTFVIFTTICTTPKTKKPIKAVTIVPVADLLLHNMKTVYPHDDATARYKNIPFEGAKMSIRSCARAHQLLFNERVEILDQRGDELFVRIPHLFYEAGTKKKSCYWTHKNNLIPIKLLEKKGLNTSRIPAPIDFSNKTIQLKNTVTLILPFFDPQTSRTFSAGTRFVRAQKQKKRNYVDAWTLNPTLHKFNLVQIPKEICLDQVPKNKRLVFLQILQQWAREYQGFIPYVWGGCSFTKRNTKKEIGVKTMKLANGTEIPIYFQKNQTTPLSGFDCTGVVARAAQLIGVPYFFKNSATAARHLKKIDAYKKLQPGDFLYFSGHLMTVSDLENNKIIEARTHWHGFGKLQEVPLEKIFKEIKTYQQLYDVCAAGKPIHRLDADGKIAETKYGAQFLKFPV